MRRVRGTNLAVLNRRAASLGQVVVVTDKALDIVAVGTLRRWSWDLLEVEVEGGAVARLFPSQHTVWVRPVA